MKTRKLRPGIIIAYVILGLVLLYTITPFLWMIFTSLKTDKEAVAIPPTLWPQEPTLDAYVQILVWGNFPIWFLNSTIISLGTALLSTFIGAFAGYGFSRFRFPGRNVLFFILLGTMMLPGTVTFIPVYILFAKMGWIYTFLPLIVPPFLGAPFNIFLMRQFLMTIPVEMDEAARIDGASSFRIFWSILLPLMRPAVATVAIFSFMSAWNDFFGPLMYLRDDQYTISLGLAYYRAAQVSGAAMSQTNWHYMMAIATLAMLPNVLIFFFAQKQFIGGITLTGVKG